MLPLVGWRIFLFFFFFTTFFVVCGVTLKIDAINFPPFSSSFEMTPRSYKILFENRKNCVDVNFHSHSFYRGLNLRNFYEWRKFFALILSSGKFFSVTFIDRKFIGAFVKVVTIACSAVACASTNYWKLINFHFKLWLAYCLSQ